MHVSSNRRSSRVAMSLGLAGALGGGIVVAGIAGPAHAATVTWARAMNDPGNWNDGANWTGGMVPTTATSDQAQINNGGIAVIDAAQGVQSVGSVTLGAALNDTGTLRVTGGGLTIATADLRIGGNGLAAATGNGVGTLEQSGGDILLTSNGNVNIGIGAAAELADGTYTMSGGTLNVTRGFIIAVGNNGNGTVNQSGGSVFVRGADQANPTATTVVQLGRNATNGLTPSSGSYALSGGDLTVANVQFGRSVQTAGAASTNTFTLSGTGKLTTGTIAINNTGATNTFNFTGGTLTANQVNLPLVNNGGTLSPSALRFGTTNITVNTDPAPTTAAGTLVSPIGTTNFGTTAAPQTYTQNSGTLAIEIAGSGAAGTPTGFDFVNVTGAATLAGALLVDELGGFDPSLGSTFDVLTATSITSTLTPTGTTASGNNYAASIVSGGNGQVLRLTVVPEPAAIGLVAVGALGLLARRRRMA